jgi:hypothetical protein
MKIKFFLSTLSLLLITIHSVRATTSLEMLGRKSVSENPAEAGSAIAELRAMGPAGLNSLFQLYDAEISRHIINPLTPATPEWQRLSAALDAVSQQRDSYLSGLYWYTDLTQAKAAAKASGKPILSLRLLGNLNEEFSCANSRFFRAVLYSNATVSQVLRERFILHWQSVRPAPRITIDFGDGRKLERTITGNSIHYILDADGRIIDALPGLYGPQAFLRALGQSEDALKRAANPFNATLRDNFAAYHRARLNEINVDWYADTQKSGGKIPEGLVVLRNENGAPTAIQVAALAMTKMVTEASLLRSMVASGEVLEGVTDQVAWNKIAALHLADAQLDCRSIGLIQRQTRNIFGVDDKVAASKLNNLLRQLQLNVALDTVRNEYVLHAKLHAWLINDPLRNDLDAFNEKVYAQLFLTPRSDPWLGLFSEETYTALENGGIVH